MCCPRCKKTLEKAIFNRVEIDYCPKCLGMFFDEEELRWAKDERDRNLAWLDIDLWEDKTKFKIGRGARLCPCCRLPLYEVFYGGSEIVVDLCNVCKGVWLDRGEFKKIIDYLKRTADREVLTKYAKNLFKEFQEIFSGPETFREEILDFLTLLKILNYKFAVQHQVLAKIISNLPR